MTEQGNANVQVSNKHRQQFPAVYTCVLVK